jgi:hypothetical protein
MSGAETAAAAAAATTDSAAAGDATTTSSGTDDDESDGNSVVEVYHNNVRCTSGRWFELPADVDASQNALRPDYLPDGPCYERRPVTDLWQKMTDVTKKQWQWRTYKNNNSSLSSKELRKRRGGCFRSLDLQAAVNRQQRMHGFATPA